MSRLEQLQKAVDDALEEIQKASDAWYAYGDADDAAYDAAWVAFSEAKQELRDYKKEHKL